MKLLLISETSTRSENRLFPTSLFALASMLGRQPELGLKKLRGLEVKIDRADSHNIKKILERHSPDVVGVGVYEGNLVAAGELCRIVRQAGIPVIVGGTAATFLPRTTMHYTEADILCRGEADLTFRQVMERLIRREEVLGIDGVMIRNEHGEVCESERSERIPIIPAQMLELITPDRAIFADALNGGRFNGKSINIQTSRGCAFGNCSFCQVTPDVQRGFRNVNPERAVQLIKWAYGQIKRIITHAKEEVLTHTLGISDSVFGGLPKELRELLHVLERRLPALGEAKDGIALRAYLSVDQLLKKGKLGLREPDADLIEDLQYAGVHIIEMGVESFSDKILKRMKGRRYTAEEAKRVVLALVCAHRYVQINLIMAEPKATLEEIEECIKGAKELASAVTALRKTKLKVGINTRVMPFVGTLLYREITAIPEPDLQLGFTTRRIMGEKSIDPKYPYFDLHAGSLKVPISQTIRLAENLGDDLRKLGATVSLYY